MPPLIVLAAGRGSRMGGHPKGLLDVGGRTLVERHLDAAAEAGVTHAVVVVGESRDQYRAAFPAWFDVPSAGRVTGVVNHRVDLGPFESLRLGIEAAWERGGDVAGCFVMPVDTAPCRTDTWRVLREAAVGLIQAVMPVHGGRGGHPVWLSPLVMGRIRGMDPDHSESRLDMVLRALPEGARLRIEVADPSVVSNLNTPADARRWLG